MNKQHFNPRELLTLAARIEKNGWDYYTRMAKVSQNGRVRKVFELLAEAEIQHGKDFQRIETTLATTDLEVPDEYLSPEIAGYLQSLADGSVYPSLASVDEIAAEIHSDEDAVRHAISFEKDTIVFFHEFHDLLPADSPDRAVILELIRQEKIHIAKLYTLMGELRQSHA